MYNRTKRNHFSLSKGLTTDSEVGSLSVSNKDLLRATTEEKLRMFEVVDAIMFISLKRLLVLKSNSIRTKGSPFSRLPSKSVVELEYLKGVQKIKSRLFTR